MLAANNNYVSVYECYAAATGSVRHDVGVVFSLFLVAPFFFTFQPVPLLDATHKIDLMTHANFRRGLFHELRSNNIAAYIELHCEEMHASFYSFLRIPL